MMLIETMKEHKLHTEVWWVPLPSTANALRMRAVRNLLERQGRSVSYEIAAANKPNESHVIREIRQMQGFTEHHSLAWEPLALYIRLLYGDGIFYSRTANGMIWLLIVHDGMIVPGTDCLLSPLVFDALMEDKKFSQYKALSVKKLQEDCTDEILAHYQANQQRLKKRRYIFYGVLFCIGLVLLASVPAVFILIG
ncbi:MULTISPECIES: hypothetical protein [unclassified Providencia]|uniref:hypothetical protein n=1 Tax=unclassified Providencia TaxID=2633465 RepID=UPI00234B11A2|nr:MULTISPECIES: hypothetical protein [unclassified Providencia]